MKRLTAYVSGKVQKTGYRARVVETARVLGLKGSVENLDDGRVRIVAEGEEEKLKWFEEAIDIRNTMIQVSYIERDYSEARGDIPKFYKMVESGETDSRLDTAAAHLKDLIAAVNNMNNNLGGKMDAMIGAQQGHSVKIDLLGSKIDLMNDNLGGKMDVMIQKQDLMLDLQHDLVNEIKDSRKDLKGYLEQRFEKLEGEVNEMRAALKAKGLI